MYVRMSEVKKMMMTYHIESDFVVGPFGVDDGYAMSTTDVVRSRHGVLMVSIWW